MALAGAITETLDVAYASDDYVGYVERANLRRDLEPGERVMAYAALARMKPGEGGNQHTKTHDANLHNAESKAAAAEKAGVSERTMAAAMAVDRRGSPELIDAVKSGQIAVSAAAKVIDALPDHAQQNAAVEAESTMVRFPQTV